ncbi:MAG TPA: hypothetical protein VHD36_18700 [Pirellulales bacterium]|nr:hypothetical protein [Pirellulales bacterium]
MPKRKKPQSEPPVARDPNPTVEFVTVAWMLSVMTALVCELGFVAARAFLLLVNGEVPAIRALAAMLFFAALVVGLVSLGLMVIVMRMRRDPPPRGIVAFAAVVGVLPVAALLVRMLAGGVFAAP